MNSHSHAAARNTTCVVELTPSGRGAVAVVLVAGPDALRAVGNCFTSSNGQQVSNIPYGRIALGRWGGPAGEELISCKRDSEQIEIHCHGGAAAVQAVVDALVDEGCRQVAWQEWTSLSSPDRICAAARIALADAMTERTAAILVDQLNGALTNAVREIIDQVAAANWEEAAGKIDELMVRRELGLHLTKPWRVVVCGAPNVGKSSLINTLAGYERAIVSPVPGTTRDVVTVTTAIDGWPVQLADTAGFRSSPDALESAGMELAAASLADADLAILVHDATKLDNEADYGHTTLQLPARAIEVINKIDLVPLANRPEMLVGLETSRSTIREPKLVSAITGEGIADLVTAIRVELVPAALPAGSAVPFTAEQIEQLAAARDAVIRRDAPAATAVLQAMLTGSMRDEK